MVKEAPLGFGIIGCGLVADFHARALAEIPGARLVAAAELDPARLESFVAQWGCESASDARALLKRPGIHVINVCTPNHLHKELVIAAARASKHVMVEKPPEVTLDKADNMIAACREESVKLATVLQVRFRPALVAIKNAIDDGRFGRLLMVDAHMKWFRERAYFDRDAWRSAASSGIVMHHAFHYIDVLRWLTGGILSVRAETFNLLYKDLAVEDSALARFRYRDGAVGVLEASTVLYPGTEIRIEVHGENGTACLEGNQLRVWRFRDERPGDETMTSEDASDPSAGTGAAAFGHVEHREQIADMVAAVRDDRAPAITGQDGRDTLAVVLALYESAKTGQEIRVER